MNFRFSSLLPMMTLFTGLLAGCSPDAPTLDGFDRAAWTSDKNGCAGKRISLADTLSNQREALLAQPEAGILTAIGKPDLIELYKRNQKLYHYFLSGGPGCSDSVQVPSQLVIRFNAMGRAKEILLEK